MPLFSDKQTVFYLVLFFRKKNLILMPVKNIAIDTNTDVWFYLEF